MHPHSTPFITAVGEPQDGHVFSCCGKTGRISPHADWCNVNKPAPVAEPTGLEHALAEVLTCVNGVDPVGAFDDYEDCSADELHIHKQLGRIRDRITVIRAENNLPMDGPAATAEPETKPAPDYWLTLADDVHRAAVRIATLAGTGRKPTHVSLHIQLAAPGSTDPTVSAVVDTVAAAFGVEAKSTKSAGGYYEHGGRTKLGDLHINPYGYVPAPEVSELEQLRARVAELEAQRAEGGAR